MLKTVDLSNADQTVHSGWYNDLDDTLGITALGSHTLTVTFGTKVFVTQVDSVVPGATPTFFVDEGSYIYLDYGKLDLTELDSITYKIGEGAAAYITAGALSEDVLNSTYVEFGSGTAPGGNYGFFGIRGAIETAGIKQITVTGMRAGDSLGYNGEMPVFSYTDGVGALTYGNDVTGGVQYNIPMSASLAEAIQNNWSDLFEYGDFSMPVCFFRGTMILTPEGEVAIEALNIGDRVVGASGIRTIKWIGRRSDWVDRIPLEQRLDHMPVRFKAGSLADNLPTRDLLVSPGHHLHIDGLLVKAGNLLNGITIYQDTRFDRLEYLHLELDQFDIISAHGVSSESWADGGNRSYFQNADVTQLRAVEKQRRRARRPGYDSAVRHAGRETQALQERFARRAELFHHPVELRLAATS